MAPIVSAAMWHGSTWSRAPSAVASARIDRGRQVASTVASPVSCGSARMSIGSGHSIGWRRAWPFGRGCGHGLVGEGCRRSCRGLRAEDPDPEAVAHLALRGRRRCRAARPAGRRRSARRRWLARGMASSSSTARAAAQIRHRWRPPTVGALDGAAQGVEPLLGGIRG